MKEILITKSIIQWMNLQGHAVFMNEITGMPDNRNKSGFRKLRGNRGSSDIIGTLKGGQSCYIEVKTWDKKDKVKYIWDWYELNRFFPISKYKLNRENQHILEQCEFLLWQKEHGAFVIFAFSLEDVERELNARIFSS